MSGGPEKNPISPTARDAVRLGFNPSGDPTVLALKTKMAEWLTIVEEVAARGLAGRECAVAITQAQTASMWAVLAATKGLP